MIPHVHFRYFRKNKWITGKCSITIALCASRADRPDGDGCETVENIILHLENGNYCKNYSISNELSRICCIILSTTKYHRFYHELAISKFFVINNSNDLTFSLDL